MAADNPHVRSCSPCLRPGFQSLEGRDRTDLETFTQTHRLQPGDGLPEPFRTTITDALGALVLGVLPGDQVMLQHIQTTTLKAKRPMTWQEIKGKGDDEIRSLAAQDFNDLVPVMVEMGIGEQGLRQR